MISERQSNKNALASFTLNSINSAIKIAGSISELAKELGCTQSAICHFRRKSLRRLEKANTSKCSTQKEKMFTRFLVTCAVNNVPTDSNFIKSLEVYAEKNNARIIVIPIRYKNPTSIFAKDDKQADVWAEDIQKYLMQSRLQITKSLVILGDIKTQPTASDPLSGYEVITGSSSAIIGHPQIAFTTVPTPQNTLPKILATTGACTVPSYTESKAGARGEFQHSIGATVIDVGDRNRNIFHIRQIVADEDGSFHDLDNVYSPNGITENGGVAAIILGDAHVDFIDADVVEATFKSNDSICRILNPEMLVWHDILDCYSVSHHHGNDPIIKYAKHHAGRANIKEEMNRVFDFVNDIKEDYPNKKHVFVPSNHVDHLAKWVRNTDPRTDPENAVIWADLYSAMCKNVKIGSGGTSTIDPFVYIAKDAIDDSDKNIFLRRGESIQVHGIELGMHGDVGPNGARGSRKALDKIGTKSVIGHSHSPGIVGGVYQTGTSSVYGLEYASAAPSSWLHTHCVIYKNGKRTLLSIIGKEWRLVD